MVSHQFSRNCDNNDLRREIALLRRIEQQQHKRIGALKPMDETILETTIGYEQLAVDLTAVLAKQESNLYVKQALDFALLEDLDHLYRYADLLEMEHGIHAEKLVGSYTEIMPGRPTISEHRYPYYDITQFTDFKSTDLLTKLNIGIITAAEQQTMNFYMNVAPIYTSDLGRKLYQEIAMIEEEHVTHYGGLLDTTCTWLENLLMHEYTECYLYYYCYEHESDENIKKIWEKNLIQEIAHLHKAAEFLKKYDGKEWQQVIPNGTFLQLLKLGPNKEYVREVLKTVTITSKKEDYAEVNGLPEDYEFFKYQQIANNNIDDVTSHVVIDRYIKNKGMDYRFEESPHPIDKLRNRKEDNTTVGRVRE